MFRPLWHWARRPLVRRAPRYYVTRTEVESALQRERARTDRTGSPFSILVISTENIDKATEGTVVRILKSRIRAYDEIGVLSPGEVATLLPETSAQQVHSVLTDVQGALREARIPARITIYRYPRERGSEDGFSQPMEDLAPYFEQRLGLVRRSVDLAVSGIALLVLSPVFLVSGLAVKFTSPGTVFYTQKRAGLGGHPFDFYKFRSMYVDADRRQAELKDQNQHDGPIFKMKNDPRITPVGRLLRRTSIDELPQLWNVFKGDMTLIGPRPPRITEIDGYEPWQLRRLDVKGGLTCIWQVSGRSEIGFLDWVRMDLRYLDRRCWGMDLRILWKTFAAVLTGRGAY